MAVGAASRPARRTRCWSPRCAASGCRSESAVSGARARAGARALRRDLARAWLGLPRGVHRRPRLRRRAHSVQGRDRALPGLAGRASPSSSSSSRSGLTVRLVGLSGRDLAGRASCSSLVLALVDPPARRRGHARRRARCSAPRAASSPGRPQGRGADAAGRVRGHRRRRRTPTGLRPRLHRRALSVRPRARSCRSSPGRSAIPMHEHAGCRGSCRSASAASRPPLTSTTSPTDLAQWDGARRAAARRPCVGDACSCETATRCSPTPTSSSGRRSGADPRRLRQGPHAERHLRRRRVRKMTTAVTASDDAVGD